MILGGKPPAADDSDEAETSPMKTHNLPESDHAVRAKYLKATESTTEPINDYGHDAGQDVAVAASYDATDGASRSIGPTGEQYERFQWLHSYFNEALTLKVQPAMLAFSRKAKALGYFAPARWRREAEEQARVSEIALNPESLARDPREIASTIVHEMVHQWQDEGGLKKSRRGYHNAEWAAKMEGIGLMPSSTGHPGGKRTGGRMTHYIIEGGRFAQAFADLPPGALLPFVSGSPLAKGAPLPSKPKDPSKTAFVCSGGCGAKMWGKPSLSAVCKDCDVDFVPANPCSSGHEARDS
jgi:predicted SprT family Zn-dependent metalloprotease